jgi:hypothetical protein
MQGKKRDRHLHEEEPLLGIALALVGNYLGEGPSQWVVVLPRLHRIKSAKVVKLRDARAEELRGILAGSHRTKALPRLGIRFRPTPGTRAWIGSACMVMEPQLRLYVARPDSVRRRLS